MKAISNEELLDVVFQGPLLGPCKLSKSTIRKSIDDWRRLAEVLASNLGCQDLKQTCDRKRVLHYYLPVYFWVRQQVTDCKQSGKQGPCVVAISAPQGCGKTTLVGELAKLLAMEGLVPASVSIDDFYLTHAAQRAVAEEHEDNPLLQGRGHAGTHDLALGTETLASLLSSSEAVRLPRYNKSAFGGEGDRADASEWLSVTPPIDVVLFEGWMLGFRPIGADSAAGVHPALAEVDRRLGEYEGAWDAYADAWLVVEVADPRWVFKWRLQAEQQMRAEGKAGMSDEQVAAFVQRYIPAYEAYLPRLYEQGPTTARAGRTLFVRVSESRALLGGRRLRATGLAVGVSMLTAAVTVCVMVGALLSGARSKRKER